MRLQQEGLESLKDRLRMSVDAQAETIRGRYITRGTGQAMAYQRKEYEAREVLAGAPPGPHIQAEAEMRGIAPWEVATTIVQLAEQWAQVSAAIEAERLKVKAAIAQAQTVREARVAFDAAVWPG